MFTVRITSPNEFSFTVPTIHENQNEVKPLKSDPYVPEKQERCLSDFVFYLSKDLHQVQDLLILIKKRARYKPNPN
jgi:hypothetical protein